MNSIKSSTTGIKSKNAIKFGIVKLDKCEKYPGEKVKNTYIRLVSNTDIKKDGLQTLFGVKINIE